jgi:DNA-binding transcriptional regulator YiaG
MAPLLSNRSFDADTQRHCAAKRAGEHTPRGVTKVEPGEVAQARQGSGLSQSEFADALGISKRTLQEWEQGRRSPSGAAQTPIRIAKRHPEVVRDALLGERSVEQVVRPQGRAGAIIESVRNWSEPHGTHRCADAR